MMKTKTNYGNFSDGKVSKLILYQALPLTLAQLVQLLYNIVDRIYIGHMPGAESGAALTGLGLCFPLITLIAAFVNLIASGATPLCSIARGNGDQKKAESIQGTSLAMLLIIGLFSGVLIFLLKRPLLFLLGASDVTYSYASEYLNIYLLGSVFFAVGTGMNGFINLQGYPRMGMITTLIGAIMNLVLDPIFIFTLGMGVKGAALATVISQCCSACWVLLFLMRKSVVLQLRRNDIRVNKQLLGPIITLGMSGFIMAATNCIVQAICNVTLSIYGGDVYIGIMTIINSVREMIGLPINGLVAGSQPVISYNYGAGKMKRVKKGIKFTALTGFTYTTAFWIIIMLIPSFFLHIFSNDAQIIQLGKMPLIIYFMGFFMMSLQFSGQSTFVSLGRAKKSIFFSIFRKVVIVVPLTILLPKIPSLGVMGVFLAEPISNFIGGSACFGTMMLTEYRKLDTEEEFAD